MQPDLIDIGNGVTLECSIIQAGGRRLHHPSTGETSDNMLEMAVIFHPWQWLGGCMDDYVVSLLAKLATESGRFKKAVRYNYRGVGLSSGWKNAGSRQDGQDAAALITRLLEGEPSPSLCMIAYSYGNLVASEALALLQAAGGITTRGFISVAFPLGFLSRLFLGSLSSWDSLMKTMEKASIQILLLLGDNDQFTSIESISALAQAEDRIRDFPATIKFQVIHSSDHFFSSPHARKKLREFCLIYLQSNSRLR